MRRFGSGLFAALAIVLAGCLPQKQEAAYSTHLVQHQATKGIEIEALDRFDVIEVGEIGFRDLDPKLYGKTILYLNPWGWEKPSTGANPDFWQPGPDDVGDARAVLAFAPGRPVYCYSWASGTHPERFAGWTRVAMAKGVLGLFCDDWGFDRFWWAGEDSTKARIWPGYLKAAP